LRTFDARVFEHELAEAVRVGPSEDPAREDELDFPAEEVGGDR
jgi:hypothetical protein